jgi:RNA polymerase sigma-70 factor (ECF subfamily)
MHESVIKSAAEPHKGIALFKGAPVQMPAAEPQVVDAPLPVAMDIRALFDHHLNFVWRSLRRLGVPAALVDDATQEVFIVASRRVNDIQVGRERAFLFGVALRIASDQRRRPLAIVSSDPELERIADPGPTPEELADRARARAMLDEILDRLEIDLRAVFVLSELEGMTMAEIAGCLNLPSGTVASRLRRAREFFEQQLRRLEARARHHE